MTALTPLQRERQRSARARAGRIRLGMVSYLETLADVIAARAENDHLTLGYKTWQEYLDKEYGAERLKLAPEMQQKAIVELRLAGASQREIGYTLGLNQSNVSRALSDRPSDANASPDEIYDRDGNLVPPARSSLVEAMTGAIEAAADRIETAGVAAPEERTDQEGGVSWARAEPTAAGYPAPDSPGGPAKPPGPAANASAAGATGAGPVPAPVADTEGLPTDDAPVGVSREKGEAGRSSHENQVPASPTEDPSRSELSGEEAGASAADDGAPDAAEVEHPPASAARCEKCGTEMDPGQADNGFMRCEDCDSDGEHVAGDDGRCRLCSAIEAVPDAYLPLEIAEGPNGLYLRCTGCGQLVSHLKAGLMLAIALVEAHQHGCTP